MDPSCLLRVTSDYLTNELILWADCVITLCNFARDSCPAIPSNVIHYHWDTANPDHDYHSHEDRVIEFARVRDEIKEKIIELFSDVDLA